MIYRLGFASSLSQARQLVRHGHFEVNGKKVTIPSYLVAVGQMVSITEKSRTKKVIVEALEMAQRRGVPPWIALERDQFRGCVALVSSAYGPDDADQRETDSRALFEITRRRCRGAEDEPRSAAKIHSVKRRQIMQNDWRDLIKPKAVEFDEKESTATYGRFLAEPLERGYGTTIGNALRRILLSSLPGFAITAVRIKSVLHEFSTIPGVKEDVTDIVLNLKEVRLRLHEGDQITATLKIQRRGRGDRRATSMRDRVSRCSLPVSISRRSTRAPTSTWKSSSSAGAVM